MNMAGSLLPRMLRGTLQILLGQGSINTCIIFVRHQCSLHHVTLMLFHNVSSSFSYYLKPEDGVFNNTEEYLSRNAKSFSEFPKNEAEVLVCLIVVEFLVLKRNRGSHDII